MSGRRIGAGGYDWAPNSPDLSPCDFWFHGFLKVGTPAPVPSDPDHISTAAQIAPDAGEPVQSDAHHHPRAAEEDVNTNKRGMIERAVFSMRRRARECVAQGGGHFEGRKLV